jgi:enamine deaminase RidA (YjgF/YER057c/UK114 family)
MANVACRYILEQPAVGGIIIGARLGKSEHLQDNLRLFQFSLDETSKSEIGVALAKLQPVPGDCGDEYRKPPFLTATGDLSHHVDTIPPPYLVETGADGRGRVSSGTIWEESAGYCRAVRRGDLIWIAGTTATHGDRLIGGEDPAAQMHFVIDKIEGVLQSFGGRLEDVVRTRIYVPYLEKWEPIARTHGERFRHILPANTLIQASLVGKEYLVEMDVDAIVDPK